MSGPNASQNRCLVERRVVHDELGIEACFGHSVDRGAFTDSRLKSAGSNPVAQTLDSRPVTVWSFPNHELGVPPFSWQPKIVRRLVVAGEVALQHHCP